MARADVASAYDARADEYIARFGSVELMSPEDVRTISAWRDGLSGPILDAGCGPGHWTDLLDMDSTNVAVGVDGSYRFLASARRTFPAGRFAQADLGRLPFASHSVAGVLAWYSTIHAPPAALDSVIAEFARILVPGGTVLMGFFDGEPGRPFDHSITTAYYWSAEALGYLGAAHGFVPSRASTRQDAGARKHGELLMTMIA